MFSIVCFVGLFLVAIGASSAEAENTHLQTLSVNGQLYSLPSTTQILLDEELTTTATLRNLADRERHRAELVAGGLVDAVDGQSPSGDNGSTLAHVVTMPLHLLGKHVTITADTVLEGLQRADAVMVGDAVISAGLVDADARLYVDLMARHDAGDAPHPIAGNLRGPVQRIAPPMLSIQGVLVDASSAVFLDSDGRPMTARDFFADLRVDHVVSVNDVVRQPGSDVLRAGELVALDHDRRPADWWAVQAGEVG